MKITLGDDNNGQHFSVDPRGNNSCCYVEMGDITIYLDVGIPADGVIADAWRTGSGNDADGRPTDRVKISHDGPPTAVDKKLGWDLRETLQRAAALLDGYRHYLDPADDIDDAIELCGVMAGIARALADPRPWPWALPPRRDS